MASPSRISSIYVHFPFCETKCHYCDFYSLGAERTRADDPPAFENALKKEASLVQPLLSPRLETIFFGGGTPSMTPPEAMERALKPILEKSAIAAETEWTMEANPSSIRAETLREYRALGVNRISMGVQSLRDDHLKMLGRVHSREKAFQALDAIFSAGIQNVSVDLLCGVPGQTLADLELALTELTRFPITHLSCYLLTLAPHHRMFSMLPDEDTQLSHLLFLDRWMTAHGFEHYEISNFARPGKQARHNLRYWQGEGYLGLGPSAHSYDSGTGTRWKNVSSLPKYASLLNDGTSPVEWKEALTPDQKALERWMLGLRLNAGFPENWLDIPLRKARGEKMLSEGILERHPIRPGFLRLTPRGFALSDQVISSLASC